jgi:hypothetical protein
MVTQKTYDNKEKPELWNSFDRVAQVIIWHSGGQILKETWNRYNPKDGVVTSQRFILIFFFDESFLTSLSLIEANYQRYETSLFIFLHSIRAVYPRSAHLYREIMRP